MRRMFKALSVAIGAVSTLIVAITTLMFAFGKIPEAYEAACKFFPCPVRYAWIDSEPVTVSHNMKTTTEFTFPSLLRDVDKSSTNWPIEGSRKYLKPPRATCAPGASNAWKLHDGTVILENDPLLTRGWISPSWVGRPEPPDWEKFDKLAKAKFGWTPGFANNNRCPADSRCGISPDEIKKQSTSIRVPVDRCTFMSAGDDANYAPDYTSLSLTIRGNADADSLWSVVVPTQTYTKISPWSSAAAEVAAVARKK